jgi:hypothetical protein
VEIITEQIISVSFAYNKCELESVTGIEIHDRMLWGSRT